MYLAMNTFIPITVMHSIKVIISPYKNPDTDNAIVFVTNVFFNLKTLKIAKFNTAKMKKSTIWNKTHIPNPSTKLVTTIVTAFTNSDSFRFFSIASISMTSDKIFTFGIIFKYILVRMHTADNIAILVKSLVFIISFLEI